MIQTEPGTIRIIIVFLLLLLIAIRVKTLYNNSIKEQRKSNNEKPVSKGFMYLAILGALEVIFIIIFGLLSSDIISIDKSGNIYLCSGLIILLLPLAGIGVLIKYGERKDTNNIKEQ